MSGVALWTRLVEDKESAVLKACEGHVLEDDASLRSASEERRVLRAAARRHRDDGSRQSRVLVATLPTRPPRPQTRAAVYTQSTTIVT